MMKRRSLLLPVLLLFLLILHDSCSRKSRTGEGYHPVIVLSLDGFRWDYPQLYNTPNLDRIAAEGVHAESLIPCFPSKTFPNHYTLATGLYPDHHGLVNNSFLDPPTGRIYSIGDREAVEDGYFYGGEPIWNTAEKQGIRTASCFWVGTEAPVQGMQPTYWKPYEHEMPFEARIDTVISWLELPPAIRPGLIMWYIHEPDAIGHAAGPVSPRTGSMVTYLDSLVGVFLDRLDQLPFREEVSFIVLSDHGMAATSDDRVVLLDDHIPGEWIETARGGNPVLNIRAAAGYKDSLFKTLQKIPHLVAALNPETPPNWHYGSNPRCLDITLTADPGWSIGWSAGRSFNGGTHGYDPDECRDMHAIFYAMGPAFKQGYTGPSFRNIHVYSLLAYLLGIEPAPTDGALEPLRPFLRETR